MSIFEWLRRRFSPPRETPAEQAPEDWSDDLSVELPEGRTVLELVEYIHAAHEQRRPHDTLVSDLGAEFALPSDYAELAIDRVNGGIVRFQTGNRANCPDRIKDPIAWTSFQRATGNL